MALLVHAISVFDKVEKWSPEKLYFKSIIKGQLSYKYILTSVDVYESIHHKIITC